MNDGQGRSANVPNNLVFRVGVSTEIDDVGLSPLLIQNATTKMT